MEQGIERTISPKRIKPNREKRRKPFVYGFGSDRIEYCHHHHVRVLYFVPSPASPVWSMNRQGA